MSAGALRHRVTIELPVETPDGQGGQTVTWSPLATVWAEIRPLKARETVNAHQVEARTTHLVRVRHRPDILPTMRVVFGNRIFAIHGVLDDGERRRFLHLFCEEGAPA
ncbi:MAG: phage head closure protein [Alphaproteobacteria bacterium]